MTGLTKVQHQLLAFIRHHVIQRGYSPTFAAMQAHMGYASKSSVARLVDLLVERGHITRVPGKACSILPTSFEPVASRVRSRFTVSAAAPERAAASDKEVAA